jgi:hypothetical protein
MKRIRVIDLTLPLIVVGALAFAAVSPRPVGTSATEVPVTGRVVDPCAGDDLTFGGAADVVVSSRPNGASGFRIDVVADLTQAMATDESGTRYMMSGTAMGEGEATPPFPTTIAIDGHGSILTRGPESTLVASVRYQLTVTEEGAVTPTGSVEVVSLECQE